jgi:hypothetical protein
VRRRGALLLGCLAARCTSQPQPTPPPAVCEGLPTQRTTVPRGAANRVSIDGGVMAGLGIFDPSLVYPSGAPSGAMAYSAVNAPADISTAVAVSSDNGLTWSGAARVNSATPESVAASPTSTRCPSGTCKGTLVHEVPSLVEDATDPDTSRRWKVFVHSYLVLSSGALAYDLGYLGLYSAPLPGGPWTDEGKALGWLSESPLSSDDAGTLASTIPALSDCVAFTEPGALLSDAGVLSLALGCASAVGGVAHLRVELLRSFDHARSFTYVGRLLSAADADSFGSDLNAADLFVAGGRTYLSVSPSGPTALGFDGYRGCAILELTAAGDAVERSDAGTPVVCRTLDGPGTPFAGACTYAEGATALGYLLPQLGLDGGVLDFEIFSSGVAAP